jgi:hypothetical protein
MAGYVVGSASFLQDLLAPSVAPCLSAECTWLIGIRSSLGLAVLVATHVVAVQVGGASACNNLMGVLATRCGQEPLEATLHHARTVESGMHE